MLADLLRRLGRRRDPDASGSDDDRHYRAYVGPAADYDLVAAMTFNLLTCLGLREHHRLLDVGCGSLRIGRLFIPYLNAGHYVGVEPNGWLIRHGIRREVGGDQVRIKRPRFLVAADLGGLDAGDRFDFAVAQSVFSHTGPDLLARWLAEISAHLHEHGVLAATFFVGEHPNRPSGWIYPGAVRYPVDDMIAAAAAAGLRARVLDWKHPRQTWALFAKPRFDDGWLEGRALGWNTFLEFGSAPSTVRG